MKKLLLLSAIAFASMTAGAQTVSVTVRGEQVKNGENVTVNCLKVEPGSYTMPDGTVINYVEYSLDPEVMASSSTTGNFEISVSNTSTSTVVGGILFCWPQECVTVAPGATLSQKGTLEAGKYSPLKIDTSTWDEPIASQFTYSCVVNIAETGNSANTFSFNLNMVHDPADYENASVNGVEMDSDAPKAYFDLNGRKVLNPEKGQILIERQGGNTRKVVM